jgi:hypothetical protein
MLLVSKVFDSQLEEKYNLTVNTAKPFRCSKIHSVREHGKENSVSEFLVEPNEY